MSVDITFISWEAKSLTDERIARDAEVYSALGDLLRSDELDLDTVSDYESVCDCVRSVEEIKDGLEPKPAENSFDVDAFAYSLYSYPFFRIGDANWMSLIQSAVIYQGYVPDWLGERTVTGAGLWCKLVGRWKQAREYGVIDDTVELPFGNDRYLLDDVHSGGFLVEEEMETLAGELYPILEDTMSLYESLDEKYRKQIARSPPTELVRALCLRLTNSAREPVLFTITG